MSHSSTRALPSNINAARSRMGATRAALPRMASIDSHELVAMQVPDCRSTNSDSPTHPSISVRAGMTTSRTCAIPMSIDRGCAWMVVERAYTVDPFRVGWHPGGATGPTSYLPLTGGGPQCPNVVALTNDWLVATPAP